MKYFRKLVWDRIYLSPRNSEDVEKFTEWLNDFETTDYLGRSGILTTLDGEKNYLEKCNSPEASFVIVTINDNKMIGTEAIQLILEYGFKYLNLHSIKLDLISCNTRAHKCYLKCGFKDTGSSREEIYLNGKYYDKLHMDILENEFEIGCIKNKNI